MAAVRAASHARVILVVDECSADVRSSLTRAFGSAGPNLTIVSIYQDEEDGDRSAEYRLFAVPLLPNEEIERVRSVAPKLGQHNAEIFGRLGVSEADMKELRAKGVL